MIASTTAAAPDNFAALLRALGAWWLDAKMALIAATDLSNDALHVHLALVLLLLVAALLRSRPDGLVPWLVVLALQLFNEAADLALGGDPDRARALAASWHDIVNTMVWPTVLLLGGRLIWRPGRAGSSASGSDGGEQPLE